jgi:N-acetylneuraminic acid mutarotase
MKCSSIFVLLILVVPAVPLGASSGSEGSAGARSDPAIAPSDSHNGTASWDFSDYGAYCATGVNLGTGGAELPKTYLPGPVTWTKLANMGAGGQREAFSAAYDDVNGQVIVHGGRYFGFGMQDTDWYRPLQTYDPALNAWTDHGAAKLPAGNVGVWDGPDGAFLTHGGYSTYLDMQGQTAYSVQNATFAWLPSTQAWSQRADGPRLYHHAAVYDPDDGLMITMGGMDTRKLLNQTLTTYYNTINIYNYSTDRWSQRNASGSLPPVRAYHSAVWDNESGQMIIFGGYSTQGALSDCWAYNYTQNRWTQLTSATPSRYMHAAAWDPVRSEMIICAGRAGGLNANDTLVFDPSANAWSSSTKLAASSRILCSGAFDTGRDQMIVLGGGDGSGQNQLQDANARRHGDPTTEYVAFGSVQSGAMDLGPAFHSINKVSWDGDMPVGTGVTLRFRAANLNVNAAQFAEMANGSAPTQQGRYVQWNLTLQSSADRKSAPEVWAVRVDYTLNTRPAANATGPAQASKRSLVQLSGTGTDEDGDELAYRWTKLSGPAVALNTPDMPSASFTPVSSGTYVFTFVVSDPYADSPASTVTVSVLNRRPRAETGQDQSGHKGELIQVTGLGIDEDRDPLTYEWTQTGGPNVTLVQPTLQNLSFVPAKIGNYTFRLVVDDGEEKSAPAVANVVIEGMAPEAVLSAAPSSTYLNENVNLSASGSADTDGRLVAYDYDFGDGNRTGWTFSEKANHSYMKPGTYNATVKVKDDDGFVSEPSPAVKITVQNRPPVTGASVTPETGNTSTVFKFLVPKGETYDPDGTIVSYFWDFGDGTNATSTTATHKFLTKGFFEVRFIVTDNWGATTEQVIDIVVVNRPPDVQASVPAQTFTMKTGWEQLFSADAADPDTDAVTYSWTINGAARPETGNRLFFKPEKPGAYRIVLTISDGESETVQAWDVTVKKKSEAVAESNLGQLIIPAAIIIVVAAIGAAAFAVRRAKPKEAPLEVFAPPGYKPGDALPEVTLATDERARGRAGEGTSERRASTPPSSASAESAEPVATVMAMTPAAGGPAPMEAIPYAEPIAPSAGSAAMEAQPITDDTAVPAAPSPAPRAPQSYQPPPKSGLSPREPYAEQIWKK